MSKSRFYFDQLGFEGGRCRTGEQSAKGPEFFRNKGESFLFSFYNKSQSNGLYAPRRNTAFDGFP